MWILIQSSRIIITFDLDLNRIIYQFKYQTETYFYIIPFTNLTKFEIEDATRFLTIQFDFVANNSLIYTQRSNTSIKNLRNESIKDYLKLTDKGRFIYNNSTLNNIFENLLDNNIHHFKILKSDYSRLKKNMHFVTWSFNSNKKRIINEDSNPFKPLIKKQKSINNLNVISLLQISLKSNEKFKVSSEEIDEEISSEKIDEEISSNSYTKENENEYENSNLNYFESEFLNEMKTEELDDDQNQINRDVEKNRQNISCYKESLNIDLESLKNSYFKSVLRIKQDELKYEFICKKIKCKARFYCSFCKQKFVFKNLFYHCLHDSICKPFISKCNLCFNI